MVATTVSVGMPHQDTGRIHPSCYNITKAIQSSFPKKTAMLDTMAANLANSLQTLKFSPFEDTSVMARRLARLPYHGGTQTRVQVTRIRKHHIFWLLLDKIPAKIMPFSDFEPFQLYKYYEAQKGSEAKEHDTSVMATTIIIRETTSVCRMESASTVTIIVDPYPTRIPLSTTISEILENPSTRLPYKQESSDTSQESNHGVRPTAIYNEALREYCDKKYHQILPIIAEEVHQNKVHQEKLKAVKARLNFKDTSRHSESGTPDRRRTSRKGSDRGMLAKSKPKKQKSSVEDDLSQPWACEETDPFTPRIHYFDFSKTRIPSHIKTYDGSKDPEDHLKIFQAVTKTKRWAIPTWCHMFNSTLTGNAKRDEESTDEFVRRYKLECRDMKGASKYMKIFGFMHGITNPELIKRLRDKIPKSVDEMIRVTTTFPKGEVAALNREWKKSFPSWKQQEVGLKQNFKREDFRTNKSQNESRTKKRNASKFYEFHEEVGHTTDECMHLKMQIEEMLKTGKLPHLVKELNQSNGKDQEKASKKGETLRKDKSLAILMVRLWQRVPRQKITQTFFLESVISFPPLREEDGTKGPMIIKAEMGGYCMHRMYVDGGSSLEILYEHCFNRFRLEVRNQMIHATTPLVGFSGEIIWPLGQISLLVKIGDEEHSTSAWMNFMVVRSPFPYNGIIGRSGVRKIWEILSTTHRMLKFPVAGRTVTLRSSMIIPLVCIMVSRPGMPQPIIDQVAEEKIQKDGRSCADCYGATLTYSPGIAGHMLNIHKGCLPIRQKNRGQAPERNKAICKEVEKLVDADIMKEVHYHSWLSNPVMVKKYDGNWRMCLDFKDLNKACAKDGYSLPEIDWKVESLCREAEIAFKQMKELIAELPMLTAPKEKEELIMYLEAAKEAISVVLMTERDRKQMPIYFVSRALQGPKVNYTPMEKLILALTKNISQRINLADFIKERSKDNHQVTLMDDKEELPDPGMLFTNESSCIDGSRAGLIITNPKWMEFTYALRFMFNATNNKVNEVYVAKEPGMIKYLKKVKNQAVLLRNSSSNKELKEKSIDEKKVVEIIEEEERTWMTPIYEYLTEEIHPEEKRKSRAIRRKAGRYAKANGILYKKSFLGPWLRCVRPLQEARSKAKMEKYYNVRVRSTSFRPGDLVYRNNEASHAEDEGKLRPK
nr:hypothetical protein [Tanacetum cinerariifolium]